MNSIKVEITQDLIVPDFDKQTYLTRTVKTEDEKSENLLQLYALYEFYKLYDRIKKSNRQLKEFDLRYPITFKIFWNSTYHDSYSLKRIQSNKTRLHSETSFYSKNSLYVLRTQILNKNHKRISTETSPSINKIEPINLDRIFNTIEYIQKGILKFPTPILYTGWTQ